MIQRMSRSMDRRHAADRIAIVEFYIGIERIETGYLEANRGRAGLAFQFFSGSDVIVMRVADQDQRDLTTGMTHDGLDMLRMIFRARIENNQALPGFNQV